jgi:hypothetical protein
MKMTLNLTVDKEGDDSKVDKDMGSRNENDIDCHITLK